MPRRARCSVLGSKKHKCVKDELAGKKGKGIHPEVPHKKGAVPGLKRNRRPDVVVCAPGVTPPTQPCDVYDAKFPCSEVTKLKGAQPSKAIPAAPKYTKLSSKEMKDYKKIAGGGKSKVLTPKDCEKEKCP